MLKPTAKHTIFCTLAISLASIVYFANSFNQRVRNSYAVWWAADMVIEHMAANDNQWPTGWEDLRDDYQTCVKRSGKAWTFEEIQTRVSIDFSLNGKMLVDSAGTLARPAFRVIWLSDGTDAHLPSREPNTIILNYLQGIALPQPAMTGFGGSTNGSR